MKHITIVVPDCLVNLNSIGGAYEILNRANEYWMKAGNKPGIEIQIASFKTELKSHGNYLPIHPVPIKKIRRTDLVIIPSIIEDPVKVVEKNKALIDWIREQYKIGTEI